MQPEGYDLSSYLVVATKSSHGSYGRSAGHRLGYLANEGLWFGFRGSLALTPMKPHLQAGPANIVT